MNSDLLDRLQRWAKELPITESIPVSKTEVCELALYAEKCNREINRRTFPTIVQWLDIIEKGNFAFGYHKVVVI